MPRTAGRHKVRRARQILSAPGDADQPAPCLQRVPAAGDRALSVLRDAFRNLQTDVRDKRRFAFLTTWTLNEQAKLAQQPDHRRKIHQRGSGRTEGLHPILNYDAYTGVTNLNNDHAASDRLQPWS